MCVQMEHRKHDIERVLFRKTSAESQPNGPSFSPMGSKSNSPQDRISQHAARGDRAEGWSVSPLAVTHTPAVHFAVEVPMSTSKTVLPTVILDSDAADHISWLADCAAEGTISHVPSALAHFV